MEYLLRKKFIIFARKELQWRSLLIKLLGPLLPTLPKDDAIAGALM